MQEETSQNNQKNRILKTVLWGVVFLFSILLFYQLGAVAYVNTLYLYASRIILGNWLALIFLVPIVWLALVFLGVRYFRKISIGYFSLSHRIGNLFAILLLIFALATPLMVHYKVKGQVQEREEIEKKKELAFQADLKNCDAIFSKVLTIDKILGDSHNPGDAYITVDLLVMFSEPLRVNPVKIGKDNSRELLYRVGWSPPSRSGQEKYFEAGQHELSLAFYPTDSLKNDWMVKPQSFVIPRFMFLVDNEKVCEYGSYVTMPGPYTTKVYVK